MREFEGVSLLDPQDSTAAGVTGGYVDLQGFINPGGREMAFVLAVGTGTTAGTAGGKIQSAEDTSGTGLATVTTFTTVTSAGGTQVKYGVVKASHRYVRFLGTVQTGKDAILSCFAQGQSRVSP